MTSQAIYTNRLYADEADRQAMAQLLVTSRPPGRLASFPSPHDLHEIAAQLPDRYQIALWDQQRERRHATGSRVCRLPSCMVQSVVVQADWFRGWGSQGGDMMEKSLDEWVAEALEASFSGWDFSWLADRWITDPLPWNYGERVSAAFSGVESLLDMGTGGGEFLASLAPLPPDAWATENYVPNMPIARGHLEPLGIHLVTGVPDDALPFPSERFDLVINRHESYEPAEVYRTLKPGGRFITQQVGGHDNIRLNELLQDEVAFEFAYWTPDLAVRQLQAAGFEIVQQLEAFPETRVADIGAVVYYLRAAPWQVEGFSVETHRHRLAAIHSMIDREGVLRLRSHRFYLEALKSRNAVNTTRVLA